MLKASWKHVSAVPAEMDGGSEGPEPRYPKETAPEIRTRNLLAVRRRRANPNRRFISEEKNHCESEQEKRKRMFVTQRL